MSSELSLGLIVQRWGWGSVWEGWGRMEGEMLGFDFGYLHYCIVYISDWVLEG